MKSHFTNKFFTGNRARLRDAHQGLIVVGANGLLQRGADTTYRFSQDANFWYLTGVDEPDVILVMDGDEEYLVLPEQSDYQKVFDGTALESSLSRRSGVKRIYDNREGWKRLGGRLKATKRAATVMPSPAYIDTYGMYTNPARASLIDKLRSHRPDLKLENVALELARLRMIKQPPEMAALREAIDITVASLKDAFKGKYRHEYELEAAIAAGFRRRGASGHAFEPIVAAGRRACVLHSVSNDSPIARGDLVVVDVGAEVEHYGADITRTVSLGRPSARQKAVHDAVLEAQKFAIGLIKPGLDFHDYRDRTDSFVGEKLQELGLIKTVNTKNIRKYYPHSISHFLGLNAHDAGDYGQPVEAGTVLTVEPGIYIPQENIGVRIEDDVLVTAEGREVLSAKLPRRLG